ncbi:AAC(3) family N-acetyltransferase [Candidatus Poribacteria bacterium]
MIDQNTIERIASDLGALGIQSGDMVLVHSSLKSLGYVKGGPETVIQGLLQAVGDDGTLLMPALSYGQEPHHIHSTRETPSNVGTIPEYFRKRAGTFRSIHPTHSVCGIGKGVPEFFKDHHLDRTPCGPNSPLNRMIDLGAKIIMLGCGLRPNTTMHALEEYEKPPYLFGGECIYTITDWNGKTYNEKYRRHGFAGWKQRYDRVAQLTSASFIRCGNVLEANTYVLGTQGLRAAVLSKMREAPCFFVDRH